MLRKGVILTCQNLSLRYGVVQQNGNHIPTLLFFIETIIDQINRQSFGHCILGFDITRSFTVPMKITTQTHNVFPHYISSVQVTNAQVV